jgi:transposase-like protein
MGNGGSSLICPHCKQETGIGTAGIFDHVFMSRKKCERCGKEFLIVNDVPMKPEDYQASGQA